MSESVKASFGLVVRFDLIEGHERAFDELVTETVREIRESEPGTLEYIIHLDPSLPGVRVFYELYQDEAAFQGHEAQPHVQRFLRDRAEHLRTDPEVWRVVPAAGVIRRNMANVVTECRFESLRAHAKFGGKSPSRSVPASVQDPFRTRIGPRLLGTGRLDSIGLDPRPPVPPLRGGFTIPLGPPGSPEHKRQQQR